MHESGDRRRWLGWVLLASGGGLGFWLMMVSGIILLEASPGRSDSADVIIVLGAAAYGTQPSPVLRERLRHAVGLYRSRVASHLLFTGGKQRATDLSEAEVSRRYALEQGVAPEDILLEDRSTTTAENLENAKRIMQEHHLSRALLVSDPYHMARARLVARQLGLEVETSPTPTTRFRTLSKKLPFLLRECYFYTTCLLGLAR